MGVRVTGQDILSLRSLYRCWSYETLSRKITMMTVGDESGGLVLGKVAQRRGPWGRQNGSGNCPWETLDSDERRGGAGLFLLKVKDLFCDSEDGCEPGAGIVDSFGRLPEI